MSTPEAIIEVIDCANCGEPIETRWQNGLLPGNYILIADWVFHPKCWDALVELGEREKEKMMSEDSYTLLQDVLIPAGTKFYRAPNERGGDNAVEAVIGLGKDWTLNVNTPILGIKDAEGWLEKSS